MRCMSRLDEIAGLYAAHGHRHYGEGVTQVEHALQCAVLAERAGGPPSLVVAALLHDIGHLFEDENGVVGADKDHRHEAAGAVALRSLFGPAVCAPISLHVAAKRYLCAVDAGYHDRLSAASRASLVLQGGAFNAAEAAHFKRRPFWREAVALRRFDDGGKAIEASGRTFDDYMPLIAETSRR